MSGLNLVTLIVPAYDPAITYYTQTLGFALLEDSASLTNDGQPKRWVVVQPPSQAQKPGEETKAVGGGANILLAEADGPEQLSLVGRQFGGRVGFFWSVNDFWGTYERLRSKGVEFAAEPRKEVYGTVVVFSDFLGNKWDLLGPAE
jgi:catechol 2,3-dioxygenase-like lactoylglutathione lyase family enzyme